ncbi:hypothetical protein GCM10009037_19660 [Halarchaeum grantii]|uniref:Glycosyl transferases group 1 n=1 Tax=Halarchaeum grantii TaxID=1193105 RepID=A0A830F3T1_9EURY|nr:glycosyltransferase [Halarchaeum grantii]GGL36172.1 hypothetical protein GCM10009037_19660 [Halarchaeum grantii]
MPQHPIAVSELTAGRLAEIGPDRDRIRVVPNGIDYEQIRETTPASDGFDVLFAGRLIEDKRVDVLLDAFDRASTDETLGIVGDGPMREALEAHARGLDSAGRITFTGFLEEYADVVAQMRAAEVFASPSTREGFGLTYAEAMAAGCTVIGAEHPESAADEVIGEGGFLATPTVDGVAGVLERALAGERPPSDPVMRAGMFIGTGLPRMHWTRIGRPSMASGRWPHCWVGGWCSGDTDGHRSRRREGRIVRGRRPRCETVVEKRDTPTPPLPLLVRSGYHQNDRASVQADSNNVDRPVRTAETDCSNRCSLYFPPLFP